MGDIDYRTVLEALLPPGSLWEPAKTLIAQSAVGVELITNGTFDSDLSGWTLSGDGGAFITWESGEMKFELIEV